MPFHQFTNPTMINLIVFGHEVVLFIYSFIYTYVFIELFTTYLSVSTQLFKIKYIIS